MSAWEAIVLLIKTYCFVTFSSPSSALSLPRVPEVCLARFPLSVKVSIVTRAKSRSGPRETSGTQGALSLVKPSNIGGKKGKRARLTVRNFSSSVTRFQGTL